MSDTNCASHKVITLFKTNISFLSIFTISEEVTPFLQHSDAAIYRKIGNCSVSTKPVRPLDQLALKIPEVFAEF
jgi:hypothetical protein